ncbi:FILIA-N KH-like domain-containing protein [Syngnathoides biaculeatus]|uniref:FILIA-N KH-like domain-containing protein n=1 Tax=Syngnathoides biaculeatus TaxID=300417 RepID=UPI002ADE2742|nr:FILIA-N KH-like domain-containing protein [Syngnathoides biaculeatus]
MEPPELESSASVAVFTVLAILLAAAAILLRRREEARAHDEPSSRQAGPQPEAVSTVDPEPVQKSKSHTRAASAPEDDLLQPVCRSEPLTELASIPDPLLKSLFPDPVKEFCFVREPFSESDSPLASTSGPETAPQPEAITKEKTVPLQENSPQLEPVRETLVAPEPVPETVPQLEPVHETLVGPKPFQETIPVPEPQRETLVPAEPVLETVTQRESAIEKCYAVKEVAQSTIKPVAEQLSIREPMSEQGLQAVVLVSEPLTVAQLIPGQESRSKPVSDLQPVIRSESEPKEFLQVAAERLLGPGEESVFAQFPESYQEKPATPKPVAERAADDPVPQAEQEPQPELYGAAAEDDKVTFVPGKKANKFEMLMSEEELEQEQRVQQEQLAAIFLLLRENAEALGEVTEGDMEEQFKLYSL